MRLTCVLPVPAGGEQPIPLWNEHDTSADADKPKILLYSVSLMFKVTRIQFLFVWKCQKSTSVVLREGTRFKTKLFIISSNKTRNGLRFNCLNGNVWKPFSSSQGIQMTATTPSMRAVRFETGLIELELSNRIQCKAQPGGSSSYLKLFGKCQVDLNLALGQIVKHQVQMSIMPVK